MNKSRGFGVYDRRPLISVVMAVYNGEEYLTAAIESILQQNYQNLEIIIINDASTDETSSILKRYLSLDNRIKLIDNETNIGLGVSLQQGINIAQGEYIARMDADDISLPNRFEKQIGYLLDHPDVLVLGGKASLIGQESEDYDLELPMDQELIRWNMLLGNGLILIHGSVMFRREFFDRFGTYNDFRAAQDFELWSRTFAIEPLPIANLGSVIYLSRDNKNSTTRSRSDLQEQHAIETRLSSIEEFLGRPVSPNVVTAYRHPGDNYDDIHECILIWIEIYRKFLNRFKVKDETKQFIKDELLYEVDKYTTLRPVKSQVRIKASIWKLIPLFPLKITLNLFSWKIRKLFWNQKSKSS